MTEDEKRLTAYHEAGHAIVGAERPGRPIRCTRRRSFRAAGRSAWSCCCRSATRCSMSYEQMTSRLAHHDGRPHRRGADLRQGQGHLGRGRRHRAGDQAGARDGDALGLFDELGTVAYGENQEEVFLGRSVSRHARAVSEPTAQKIDGEVRRLVEAGLDEARRHPHRRSAPTSRRWRRACSNMRR